MGFSNKTWKALGPAAQYYQLDDGGVLVEGAHHGPEDKSILVGDYFPGHGSLVCLTVPKRGPAKGVLDNNGTLSVKMLTTLGSPSGWSQVAPADQRRLQGHDLLLAGVKKELKPPVIARIPAHPVFFSI